MKLYTNSRRVVRQWILRNSQSCQQMVQLMSETMERRPSVAEYLKLRWHLIVCTWCSIYLQQIRFLRSGLRFQASPGHKPEPTPSLSSEARQRIAAKINR